MISPPLSAFRQLAAERRPGARIGFAIAVRAAQHVPAIPGPLAPASHPIPTPSLDWRSGPATGPHLPARRAHRQGFAGPRAPRRFSLRGPLSRPRAALDSGAITTPDGGSLSCANPRFFSLFSPLRHLPAAWRPMASAPLPVLRPVRSSPMRPTTTSWPAPRSVLPAARCATTSACAAAATAERVPPFRLSPRAARAGQIRNDAAGAPCPGGIFTCPITANRRAGPAVPVLPEGRD